MYIFTFEENGTTKTKIYSVDYVIRKKKSVSNCYNHSQ